MNKIITEEINKLVEEKNKLIIAIDGCCTAGKTTLANELQKIYDCNLFHMDDFFLPFEMRTPERLSEIGGNIDYERFEEEIAKKILHDKPFSYGRFDCSNGKIGEKINIISKKINIIEGVYCLHPNFDKIYNLKIFLKVDEDEKIRRLKNRNPEKLERFINDWIPKEDNYFNSFKIEEKCDLVIDNFFL